MNHIIHPLSAERNLNGTHKIQIDEAYKLGYRLHRDMLIVKIEGRDETFYVCDHNWGVRNVLECTRPVRAAYARINGLKVADIERAWRQWKNDGQARQRREAIADLLRMARKVGVDITVHGETV